MKPKLKQIIIVVIVAINFISCGQKSKEASKGETEKEATTTKYEWVDVDLSKTKAKYPIIVKGRKGCSTENSYDDIVRIESEDWKMNYEITAYLNGIDQEMKDTSKKNTKESDAYKFEKFIIDTPDSYLIKTSNGYMVGRFVKADDTTYECSMIPLYAIKEESEAKEMYEMMGMLKAK